MAIYNEILAARFARFLTKLFSMKGTVPVRQLAGEVSTTLNLFSGTENRWLEGWNRFGRALLQPAVAGQPGKIQWRNPSNSNVVAVFEKITFTGPLTDAPTINMGASNADLAAVDPNVQTLDPRGGVGTHSAIVLSSQAAAGGGAGSAFGQFNFAANTSYDLVQNENQEIALLPGQVMIVISNVVNQALLVSAIWRERGLEDSEKQ